MDVSDSGCGKCILRPKPEPAMMRRRATPRLARSRAQPSASKARRRPRMGVPRSASERMKPDRTSRPGAPATAPHRLLQGCSAALRRLPSRRLRGHAQRAPTRDARDTQPRVLPPRRSCGRSVAAFYNSERPHEAIDLDTPLRRYQPSPRRFPERLSQVDYPDRIVRKVQPNGRISFAGQKWSVGKAFAGHRVALRPTIHDGRYDVFFCQQPIADIDLRDRP